VRRDTGAKLDVPVDENLASYLNALLDEIHNYLFEKSKRERDEKIVQVTEWKDFVPALNRHCLVLTPFCDQKEWEEKVKVIFSSLFHNSHSFRKCPAKKLFWVDKKTHARQPV
jgi:hypothetical protein